METPAAVVNKLNREFVRCVKSPEGTKKVSIKGDEVVGSSPEGLVAKIKSSIPKYAKLIDALGMRGE